MKFVKKFEAFNEKVGFGIEWIGMIAFVLMMLITTVDVIGAKVFLVPLPGSLDLMMLTQLIAMSFAIAASLIQGRHIQVEFFTMLFPKQFQDVMDIIVNLLGFILFALITWRLYVYGIDLKTYNEVSSTIRLPLYPFAMAAAIACIPVCAIYLHFSLKSILKVMNI